MKKMYFGAWQNFYHISWPVRFLIEGILFLFFVYLLCKLAKKLGRVLRLKSYMIKGSVWIVTEVVYFFGKSNPKTAEIDNRVIEWGEKKLNDSTEENNGKMHKKIKICVALGIIILYIAAVFVDMPLSGHLQEEYLEEFANIKEFFQQYEKAMSKGYEAYPPLFVKKEPEMSAVMEEGPAEVIEEKEEIPVYIQLNERGKNGANVRLEPSLDGKIVGGVNDKTEILYSYQWECDEEERYWIKIYVPSEDMEGWLSGKLVDSTQLEVLVNEPDT